MDAIRYIRASININININTNINIKYMYEHTNAHTHVRDESINMSVQFVLATTFCAQPIFHEPRNHTPRRVRFET